MGRILEIATGVVDGANTSFSTSAPYTPGSLGVWRNGNEILGSFAETSPGTGGFTIIDSDQIPLAGAWGTDQIVVEYWDGLDEGEILVVDEISCSIEDAPFGVEATVEDAVCIEATVEDAPFGVGATVEDVAVVACEVSDAPHGVDCQVEDC